MIANRFYSSSIAAASNARRKQCMKSAAFSSRPTVSIFVDKKTPTVYHLPKTPRSYYSTFQPPENNKYHGTPVYGNIDIHLSSSAVSNAAAARNTDAEAVFVVSGASRSMGLQFVKELLSRTKGRIVACVMRPGSAPALDSFLNGLSREERSRIDVHRLDVTDVNHIEQIAKDIGESYGRVDGLFNVAGVLGDKETTPGPEMNLSQLDHKWAADQMAVSIHFEMMNQCFHS